MIINVSTNKLTFICLSLYQTHHKLGILGIVFALVRTMKSKNLRQIGTVIGI